MTAGDQVRGKSGIRPPQVRFAKTLSSAIAPSTACARRRRPGQAMAGPAGAQSELWRWPRGASANQCLCDGRVWPRAMQNPDMGHGTCAGAGRSVACCVVRWKRLRLKRCMPDAVICSCKMTAGKSCVILPRRTGKFPGNNCHSNKCP